MVLQNRRWTIIFALMLAMTTAARSQSATDGPALRTAALPKPAERSQSGDCVLLQNDHVLYGRARQVGEWVIVESGNRGEIKLDRKQVACWASSIRDLYQYRVDHRQSGDIATRLRDAEWCLRYDLLDLAANELRAVYAMDSNNAQAKLIEQRLKGRAEGESATVRPTETVAPVNFESAADVPRKHRIEGEPLSRFAGQIQPMLINRCGSCHSQRMSEQTGVKWKIFAPPTGTRTSAEFTRTNLNATLPFIDQTRPGSSTLLTYATSAHGEGSRDAPMGKRNAKAILVLEHWVAAVAGALNSAKDEPPRIAANRRSQPVTVNDPFPTETTPIENGPSRLPIVENPFDPDLFNRRFRMKTNGVKARPSGN